MKKSLFLLLIVVLILSIVATFSLAGCKEEVAEVEEEEAEEEEVEGNLVIYHWWTAGGEKEAIDALFSAFLEKYPDVEIVENPVSGGGGDVLRAQIKTMIMAGDPPDTFQITYGTGMIRSFMSVLQPLNDLVADFDVPQDLLDWGTIDGDLYGIPVNVMQNNILWYNKNVVEDAGVQMPVESIEDLYAACDKIKDAGYTPIAVGSGSGQDFWLGTLFEAIVSGLPDGPEALQELYNGEVKISESEALKGGLEVIAKLVDEGYINSDYGALTWDQAGQLLSTGEAAFFVMGDWTKGLFDASGLKANVDYGYQSFPGATVFVGHSDCFVLPEGVDNIVATKWLEFLTTAEAGTAFCPIKGATPPRLDAPIEGIYDEVSIEIMDKFRASDVTKIQSQFGGPPEAYLSSFGTALSEFMLNPSVSDDMLARFDSAYDEVFSE
jgi:glucose/mannose transport system substrate-binding protein